VEKERALVTLTRLVTPVLCTNIVRQYHVSEYRCRKDDRVDPVKKPLANRWPKSSELLTAARTRPLASHGDGRSNKHKRRLTANCVLIRRDGFESAIEDSAAPIHDRAGRVIGAVIVFHDVSAARHVA